MKFYCSKSTTCRQNTTIKRVLKDYFLTFPTTGIGMRCFFVIMKNLVLLLMMSVALVQSSCRKCMTCTTAVTSTGATVDTYPETCGRKATLDAQELTYRSTLPDSLTLKCTRD